MNEEKPKTSPLIVIPARMASSRLPGKPLADIGGQPMIVHVLERCKMANIGSVIVACAEKEIYDAVISAGGKAVMTNPELPSGTDRVRIAADLIDPDKVHDIIINVQGDLPTIDPQIIAQCVEILALQPKADIATLAVATSDSAQKQDPNVVKAILSFNSENGDEGGVTKSGRALYFTRASAPTGDGPVWHHIGIYAYRRQALDKFCSLPPSPLEQRERLEQLRALEAGMRIDVGLINSEPHGVDTPDDLQYARKLILGDG